MVTGHSCCDPRAEGPAERWRQGLRGMGPRPEYTDSVPSTLEGSAGLFYDHGGHGDPGGHSKAVQPMPGAGPRVAAHPLEGADPSLPSNGGHPSWRAPGSPPPSPVCCRRVQLVPSTDHRSWDCPGLPAPAGGRPSLQDLGLLSFSVPQGPAGPPGVKVSEHTPPSALGE